MLHSALPLSGRHGLVIVKMRIHEECGHCPELTCCCLIWVVGLPTQRTTVSETGAVIEHQGRVVVKARTLLRAPGVLPTESKPMLAAMGQLRECCGFN